MGRESEKRGGGEGRKGEGEERREGPNLGYEHLFSVPAPEEQLCQRVRGLSSRE